jgi:hypothetical protein
MSSLQVPDILASATAPDFLSEADLSRYFRSTTEAFVQKDNAPVRAVGHAELETLIETTGLAISKGNDIGNVAIFILDEPENRRRPNALRITLALFRKLVAAFRIPGTVLQAAFHEKWPGR